MSIHCANLNTFGDFRPAGIERADWYGEFRYRDVTPLAGLSLSEVEAMAVEGRSYLDRNAARVELAERARNEWAERGQR